MRAIAKDLIRCLSIGAALCSLPQLSSAEANTDTEFSPSVPFHQGRARWSEDWSVLEDPDLARDDFWRKIKFIPLDATGKFYLSLGGEYRFTYEFFDPAQRGLSDIGHQDTVMNRLALHADLHLGEHWRVFGQLGYATATNREGGMQAVDESDPNVWQLFADCRFPIDENERVVVRLGRQIIETGGNLITAGEANNVRLYYDGLRVGWLDRDYVKLEAFGAEYVDYADGAFDMAGTGEYFWGANAGIRLDGPELDLSLLYLGWRLDDRQFEQAGGGRHDELRHQLVFRVKKPMTVEGQWGLDYYFVYQFGEYDDGGNSDINAGAAFGRFEYALFPRLITPVLGLATSYFSGDDDPDDGGLNTFYDPVLGTPYFTYARDVMPFNLLHLQPNIGYRFGEKLQLSLSSDFLWRASKDDAFYTSANAIGVRAGESDGRFIGIQLQFAASWKPTRHITARLHVVQFWAGDVVDDAGGGDQQYFHLGVGYLF